MAQKTSGEFEKEFVDGIKSSTGKDLAAWMTVIDGCGTKKRNEVIAWLKSEHGFGQYEQCPVPVAHQYIHKVSPVF